jgi:hypothetical protein
MPWGTWLCVSTRLTLLRACTRGYHVYMVLTMAPGPTLGEAANPQVGPTSFFPCNFSEFHTLVVPKR